MIHTDKTITLRRVSMLFETKNINLVKRVPVWMPQRYIARRYQLFMIDFQRQFSEDELKRVVGNELIRTTLFNRVVLYKSFMDLAIIDRLKNDHLTWYNSEFGHEFRDLREIDSRIKLLSSKIKEYAQKESKSEGVSFERIIIGVESVLNTVIDRDLKLYQFKYYFDAATERVKIQQNG